MNTSNRDPIVIVRPAQREDASILWNWANDPTVRRNSFRPEPISWESHRVWYEKCLGTPDCMFRLMEVAGEPVGQIRYDRDPSTGSAVVSVSVGGAYRGKGYSKELIRRTCGEACMELGVKQVAAFIILGNSVSYRCFRSVGFSDLGTVSVQGRSCHLLTWRPSE